ncbi:MAG: NAD(P)/FAD-dependent oxidoreductase [Candidatus Planktophila sp.]|nr:NAD(P)/FAD-dependent oxidoreductase [Candidatus Planktophila sp.]
MNETQVDVIVIGAGPVGLVVALGLAQNGVRVLVVEKNSIEVPSQWRGSTIHPPTLEIFDELGLADEIISGAIKVEVLQYRDLEIDEVVNFDYNCLNDQVKFPFRLQFEQYKVLKLLRSAAALHPLIEIQYESVLESVSQDALRVCAKVLNRNSLTEIYSDWLVAADGSHSSVRKSLGIELDGFTYPYPTTVVATPFTFEKYLPDLAPVTYWSGPTGRLSMIRTPDIWRIAMTTPLEGVDIFSDDKGSVSEPSADFKAAIELLLNRLPGVTLSNLRLKQYEVYRSHQRIAREFSVGRIALAGDAAHLTTTNGGMGLNSGVQDGAALVKALIDAIAQNSSLPIAKYAKERKEFCIDFLQPTTTTNHKTVDNPDYEARYSRLSELSADSKRPEIVRQVIGRASMIAKLVK